VEELTQEEQSDRLHLERKVERAFFEAGKALTELRDRRLYRSTHKTFEEYSDLKKILDRLSTFTFQKWLSNFTSKNIQKIT
jgi:hypothetical protein